MSTSILSTPALSDSRDGDRSVVVGFFKRLRRRAAERRMRDELALLDDAMLRDIGIAEDEIQRVRNLEHFTPRSWMPHRAA
jgi:uncharacterized protein YjiS (DUF1127 family)